MSHGSEPTVDSFSAGWRRVAEMAAAFVQALPALLVAMVCLRVGEVVGASQGDSAPLAAIKLVLVAILVDAISMLRYLPLLFLVSAPFLWIRSRRGALLGLGACWSVLLLMQASLAQYGLTARVPLGSDLFAYSAGDLQNTISGGAGFSAWLGAALLVALVMLWGLLFASGRRSPEPGAGTASVFVISVLLLVAVAPRSGFLRDHNEDVRNLKISKLGYFLDDSAAYFFRPRSAARTQPVPSGSHPTAATPSASPSDRGPDDGSGFRYLDPKHPFLHAERTPDGLGPHFHIKPGAPPNLVILVVEGLGRSFSGPDAALGSFTPELDKLAERSLYWENFLAVQGRTFAVLPSLLASAPFADHGLPGFSDRIPEHDSLLSVLKHHGYWLKFYSGYNSQFDNERLYLKHQGMDTLVDRFNFGQAYTPSGPWGYADGELVSRVLSAEAESKRQPFVTLVKTMTMHTPYTFPGQPSYTARFERRLDELGVAGPDKQRYRVHHDIYTSILYADEQLGRYFEGARKNPGYENTLFVVVGDHRLPEIPMTTRIERYHVPLLVFSPMLKAPARIKSVSSHFDVAPSLLAFFSNNYGVQTPRAVTWLGSGLDMHPGFRNVHHFPLKQTKTNLVDFVSGEWFLNQDQLYELHDRMALEPSADRARLASIQAEFAAFRAANDQLARSGTLRPAGAGGQFTGYREAERRPVPARSSGQSVVYVAEVRSPVQSEQSLDVEVVFNNSGGATSESFVPLLIIARPDGRELSETYGPAQRLPPGQRVSLRLAADTSKLPPGRYLLSVIALHADTGKRVGTGRHHIPVRIGG